VVAEDGVAGPSSTPADREGVQLRDEPVGHRLVDDLAELLVEPDGALDVVSPPRVRLRMPSWRAPAMRMVSSTCSSSTGSSPVPVATAHTSSSWNCSKAMRVPSLRLGLATS
jgi:hypothetical protein